MPPATRFTVIRGSAPVVLIAPHGGRRDPERRPWAAGRLKVNDLHTAALTRELAALSGGAALLNTAEDRNDVDLNRISEADAQAPEFLETMRALLDDALARHGRATLLTIHGWNVIQPAVDLGLGCAPGADPFAVGPAAAVSPAFAASAVRGLVEACAARGIAATLGVRYPARNRENLLQLFTRRHRDDGRPAVGALAALAPRVDAVQLELGIPLRWPGVWRERLLDACRSALPALAHPPAAAPGQRVPEPSPVASPRLATRLEITSPSLCALAALDAGRGERLLLFPPDGGLALFTGERTGLEEPGAVSRLSIAPTERGQRLRFRGPMLRFPDTTPFLDLEAGLARARLVEAEVAVEVTLDAGDTGFAVVSGDVTLDGARAAIDGHGFVETGTPVAPWPRLRVALRLGESVGLALTLALHGGAASGFVCRHGERAAITAARAVLGPDHAPLEEVSLEVDLATGERLTVRARAMHRLPVVRVQGPASVRIEFAACRLDGGTWPAGWCEVGGL